MRASRPAIQQSHNGRGTPTTSSVKCRGRRPARREHSSTQREIATVHHQGLVREAPAPDAPPPDTSARVRRRRIEPNAHAHRAAARHPRRRRAHRGRGADVRRLPPALLSQGAAPVASLFPRDPGIAFSRGTAPRPPPLLPRRRTSPPLSPGSTPRCKRAASTRTRRAARGRPRWGAFEPFPGTLAFRDYPPPTCRDTCRRSAAAPPPRAPGAARPRVATAARCPPRELPAIAPARPRPPEPARLRVRARTRGGGARLERRDGNVAKSRFSQIPRRHPIPNSVHASCFFVSLVSPR